MKIIDIAMCVDNVDPNHLGRIRLNRYSTQTGTIEGAFKVSKEDQWTKKDLFVATPFLPNNINFIPEINQAVKVINYNTDKDTVNVEYIAGPFTTMSDYNSQTHLAQLEDTSYGGPVKSSKKIVDKLGNYVNKKSNGAFAKHEHHGIYGKYGSDLIFTENGLMMRGGKFLSKQAASTQERLLIKDRPIMSEKSSSLYLKKFPKTKKWGKKNVTETSLPTGDLKFLIEYELSDLNLSGETNINFYIYKLKSDLNKFYRIENPNLSSVDLIDGYYELITNKSPNLSLSGETSSSNESTLTAKITSTSIIDYYVTTKFILESLHTNGLTQDFEYVKNKKNNFNITGDLHPFYFRPTKSFQEKSCTSQESTNRESYLKNINFFGIINNGLCYKKDKITPIESTKTIFKDVIIEAPGEQTFSAMKADQIYFLTTDPVQSTAENVNFNKLDPYEITQEDYLTNIHPYTYSTVRGETLLEVLQAIYKLFITHKHDILEPLEQSDKSFQELKTLIETLEQDMLNKSIRIN